MVTLLEIDVKIENALSKYFVAAMKAPMSLYYM